MEKNARDVPDFSRFLVSLHNGAYGTCKMKKWHSDGLCHGTARSTVRFFLFEEVVEEGFDFLASFELL